MIQLSTPVRNAMLDSGYEAVIGTSAKLRFFTGSPPANCATAATGTQLMDMALPSDWMANASGGSKALAGSWSGTASFAGGSNLTVGYYRILDSAGTVCGEQGTVGAQVTLTTSALTAANGNVLTFASTTGAVAGMNVAGTGIPAGTTIVAVTSTTLTLSQTSTAGVANAATITLTYDMTIDNPSLASGQTVTISAKTLTAPNA